MKKDKKVKNKNAVRLGGLGGRTTFKRFGKKHMKKLSEKALKARWSPNNRLKSKNT